MWPYTRFCQLFLAREYLANERCLRLEIRELDRVLYMLSSDSSKLNLALYFRELYNTWLYKTSLSCPRVLFWNWDCCSGGGHIVWPYSRNWCLLVISFLALYIVIANVWHFRVHFIKIISWLSPLVLSPGTNANHYLSNGGRDVSQSGVGETYLPEEGGVFPMPGSIFWNRLLMKHAHCSMDRFKGTQWHRHVAKLGYRCIDERGAWQEVNIVWYIQ